MPAPSRETQQKFAMRRWLRTLPARWRDDRGVAAVEFALVVPVMIAAYFGSLEVSQGFSASRRVAILSRTLADLAAQSTTSLSQAELDNIFAASTSVLSPFNATKLQMTISGVVFTTESSVITANTDWSVAKSGTLRACGKLTIVANGSPASPTTVPTGLNVSGTTVVVADVLYPYEPLIGGAFTQVGDGSKTSISIKQTTYMRPRAQARVQVTSGVTGNKCSVTFP